MVRAFLAAAVMIRPAGAGAKRIKVIFRPRVSLLPVAGCGPPQRLWTHALSVAVAVAGSRATGLRGALLRALIAARLARRPGATAMLGGAWL